MISRRALFGLGAGAAATAVVPAVAEPQAIMGLDFGTQPTAMLVMPGRTIAWQLANPEKMAEYRKRIVELDIRFDPVLPDATLKSTA